MATLVAGSGFLQLEACTPKNMGSHGFSMEGEGSDVEFIRRVIILIEWKLVTIREGKATDRTRQMIVCPGIPKCSAALAQIGAFAA